MSTRDPGQLGYRIAAARAQLGLSQSQLADSVGVSRSWVTMVESGLRTVTRREHMRGLAEALGVRIGDLTGQPYQPTDAADQLVHDAVPGVRAALDGVAGPTGRPLGQARAGVTALMDARAACRYEVLGTELVPALRDAHHAVERGSGDPAAAGSFVRACVTASLALRPLGYLDLAVRLSERAQWAAACVGDPVLMAAADYTRAQACLAGGIHGQRSRSLSIVQQAAQRLEHAETDDARC